MESEGENLEPPNPDQNPEQPGPQFVRVKRRRRRSKHEQQIEVSLPAMPPKKKRGTSIFKSPVFWAAMNFVTAAVTYIVVKWPEVKVATEIAPLKPPPPSKSADTLTQKDAQPNEPVEEVKPSPASSAGKPRPMVPGFFGKKESTIPGTPESLTLTEGVSVPKEFHPEPLPMQGDESHADNANQSDMTAERMKAQLDQAAKYRNAGDLDHAIAAYHEAVRLDPKSVEAAYGLGLTLEMKGNIDEAVVFFLKALRINPDCLPSLVSLAWLSATQPDAAYRNGTRAVELAERASKIASDTGTLDTLAAAYAEAGRFNDAVRTAQKAVSLAQKPEEKILVEEIQKRIELYKAGKPYHSPK